jgi:hypothetical protein
MLQKIQSFSALRLRENNEMTKFSMFDSIVIFSAAKATGWKGTVKYIEQIPSDNVKLQIFEATVVCNPRKAIELLGWFPRHVGPVEQMDILYSSWQAHKRDEEILKKLHSQ